MKKSEVEKQPSPCPHARTIAYLRVSTDAQDTENQRLEILKLANEKSLGQVEFVAETVSGRQPWKSRQIADVMDSMTSGDTLIVAELSRLGRSMYEVMEIISLAVRKSIRVYASKGGWVLDHTLQSKIWAMVMSMVAEVERDLNIQRTKAAMETRKALVREGKSWTSKAGNTVVNLGRPPGPGASKLDKYEAVIKEHLAIGVPITRIAKQHGTTPANLRNWMSKNSIEKSGKNITIAL